jgi:selenium metabolism protein YedF
MTCPNPVLKTKELIEKNYIGRLTVIVDNLAAQENVNRFLTRFGFSVDVRESGNSFEVTGTKTDSEPCLVTEESAETRKIVVLLGTETLGQGDDGLGRKLVLNFLLTLKEMGPDLWRLMLVNGGVKLAVEGADALPSLQTLEDAGVRVMVCGTCLNHFGLLEKKKVGETTNMLDIVTAMQLSDKVISLT